MQVMNILRLIILHYIYFLIKLHPHRSLTFRGPCIVKYSFNKPKEMHYFSALFGKELHMFRTDLLSIIRSLKIVFTVVGICRTSYVDCLLAKSS